MSETDMQRGAASTADPNADPVRAACTEVQAVRTAFDAAFEARLRLLAPMVVLNVRHAAGRDDARDTDARWHDGWSTEWCDALLHLLQCPMHTPALLDAAQSLLRWGAARGVDAAHHALAFDALSWAFRDIRIGRADGPVATAIASRAALVQQLGARLHRDAPAPLPPS